MPELAKFAHHGVRVSKKVVANLRAPVDGDKTVQYGVASDLGIFINKAVGPDVRSFADTGAWGD